MGAGWEGDLVLDPRVRKGPGMTRGCGAKKATPWGLGVASPSP